MPVPADSPIIFVVDDDASVRFAVRRLLLSLRLPVRLFASAEEFLTSAERDKPACLVLDVRLPGMSGLQLQEQMTSQDWKLPTIFVTAHDDEATRDAALRQGAVAFIRKPFDRAELLAGVEQAVAQTRS